MAIKTLLLLGAFVALAATPAMAQIPNAFAPQQPFYTGGIPNAVPMVPQYQPQYVPPPPIPVAPMPSPYRVIVPAYGGTSGYGH